MKTLILTFSVVFMSCSTFANAPDKLTSPLNVKKKFMDFAVPLHAQLIEFEDQLTKAQQTFNEDLIKQRRDMEAKQVTQIGIGEVWKKTKRENDELQRAQEKDLRQRARVFREQKNLELLRFHADQEKTLKRYLLEMDEELSKVRKDPGYHLAEEDTQLAKEHLKEMLKKFQERSKKIIPQGYELP